MPKMKLMYRLIKYRRALQQAKLWQQSNHSELIQSTTFPCATSGVVRWPAKTSIYLLFGFLAATLKAYSGPRRSIGSSLPTTHNSGIGLGADPMIAAFLGITAGPSGSNILR